MEIISKNDTEHINIGIADDHRRIIANGLSELLADSYLLFLKSQNYHWNVTGMHFQALHELFEEHYTELFAAIDEIAERIRALGQKAPGTFRQYLELTNIPEDTDTPSAEKMIQRLLEAHEQVIRTAQKTLSACEEAEDEATLDLLTQRLHVHAKTAWMLRSHLG